MRTSARSPLGDRGAVVALMALLMPALLIITAFAVDLGRQRSDRRSMQAAADVISLDMARLADGRTISEITAGDAAHPPAADALEASADRNGVAVGQLELDWGTFDDATGQYTSLNLDPAGIPDAARVIARDTTEYRFRPGSGNVERTGIGRNSLTPMAGFRVGSFGATLDTSQSAFLSTYVSPLLGNPVGLDAAGYEGLADAKVEIGDLAGEFGFLSSEETFDTEVTLADALVASANVLRQNGHAAEADLLDGSITTEMENITFSFSEVVHVENGHEDAGMGAGVTVPDLIQAAVWSSRCTPHPSGFPDCSGVSAPNLATSVPMIAAQSTGSFTVVESPRYHYGPVNSFVDTGQVKAELDYMFGSQYAGTCTPALSNAFCIVDGLLVDDVDVTVRVDTTVTMAGGRNTVDDIVCDDPTALGLGIGSNTDLYSVDTTVTVEFGRRGLLGGLLGSTLGHMVFTGSTSSVNAADLVSFLVPPDVLGETQKQTGAGNAGLSGVNLAHAGGSGVLGLLSDLGIQYTQGQVLDAFVNPMLGEIDQQLVGPLTAALGLNVSGSDLTALDIDCDYGSLRLVG